MSTSKVSRIQKEINEFYIKNKEMFESDIESFCRNCVAHLKKKYTTKTFIGNRHGEARKTEGALYPRTTANH